MKKIILFLFSINISSIAQDVKFEKQDMNLFRSPIEQVIPLKIVRTDVPNDKDISVKITRIQGDKVQLNPQVIDYKFLASGFKEFIFNIKLIDTDTTSKDKKIEILEMNYIDKAGKNQTQRLVINVLGYQESKPKTNEIPDLILFAGTNIDPLGVNKVSSSSFNFQYKIPLYRKFSLEMGLYTNKNFSQDSSTSYFRNYAPDLKKNDGLIENKSMIYTQKISPNGKSSIRSNGGYLNILFGFKPYGNTRSYLTLACEIIQRRIISTVNPEFATLDSITYRKNFTGALSSSPLTKESIFIPPRYINQSFFNIGFRIENSSEKFYLLILPSVGANTNYNSTVLPSKVLEDKSWSFNGAFRTYLTYKPLNLALFFDAKFVNRNSFYNFSIGIPLDIKGIFEKK